jgi:transcriptional regulator with XRE-family HTH domain
MTIIDDLREAAAEAQFTQQDIATWLEYGFSTVQNWMSGNRANPLPAKQRHIAQRLKLLRKALDRKTSGLPVPPSITQYERKAYIEGIRDCAIKGIFKQGASR